MELLGKRLTKAVSESCLLRVSSHALSAGLEAEECNCSLVQLTRVRSLSTRFQLPHVMLTANAFTSYQNRQDVAVQLQCKASMKSEQL